MNPEALLADLHERGIHLAAINGRLRVRAPVCAVTAELRETLSQNKPALLALLVEHRSSHPTQSGDEFRFTDGLMQFGDICAGWKPDAWATELRRKADRCDEYRPDIAAYYRSWAADIGRRLTRGAPSNICDGEDDES